MIKNWVETFFLKMVLGHTKTMIFGTLLKMVQCHTNILVFLILSLKYDLIGYYSRVFLDFWIIMGTFCGLISFISSNVDNGFKIRILFYDVSIFWHFLFSHSIYLFYDFFRTSCGFFGGLKQFWRRKMERKTEEKNRVQSISKVLIAHWIIGTQLNENIDHPQNWTEDTVFFFWYLI